MPQSNNPISGTRQYAQTGFSKIPGDGYTGLMEPVEIGQRIQDRRQDRQLSQEQLAAMVDAGQSTIDRIEKGQFKRMPSVMPRIAQALDLPLSELDPQGRIAPPDGIAMVPNLTGRRDFPVYVSAEGGPGEIIRSADPIDWIPRPEKVMHVRNAYGMVVSGESMEPEYRPGDTALVNPLLPPMGGEVHIFYRELYGEARASIKHLRRAAHDMWHVTQHNPPDGKKKDFTLSRKEWTICHRVFGKHSRGS